jgi:hypothetical protein|tara:strand:+ start:47 stop:661 length:615 start_codon:yes stop_codon:yes gene_type:complete
MAFVSNGTTILDAGAFSASLGSMVHIKTLTASSSATLSFVHGSSSVVLDSTYPIYLFKFFDIHPATDGVRFTVGFRDGSTNYDAAKTTTYFEARHNEGDTGTALAYETGEDLANGTGFQPVQRNLSNDNDHGTTGEMFLFNPASTTFAKHFLIRASGHHQSDYELDTHVAGYINVTAAIDAVQFKMDNGNVDAGTIKLYGIKDS